MNDQEIINKAKECLLFEDKDLGYNQKDIDFVKWIIKEAQKERDKLWSEKFDKYACIKNDKWYLNWKEELSKN